MINIFINVIIVSWIAAISSTKVKTFLFSNEVFFSIFLKAENSIQNDGYIRLTKKGAMTNKILVFW